jgi:3,4-dihydroxy 2-butanone 4-phosphate synthase/GTP cyclohydrolase II
MSKVLPLSGGQSGSPGGSKAARAPGLNSIEEILEDLRAGRMVVIMDDEDRENEGDLIMAAERATPEAVAFMIRYTSGIICVPMEEERLARLDLPQMVQVNSESHRTAFTVSVDLRLGTTTGVSSSDRAATIRALADGKTVPSDFARPGHIFPLRSEVMNDDGTMARRPELETFAHRHNLKIGTISDLIRYRLRNERSVERTSEQTVQTELGEFRLYTYEDRVNQDVHLALARGRLDGSEAPLVRVHLAETLRDLLGIQGGPRAWTLRAAMQRIAVAGNGVIVLLRQQESPQDLAAAAQALVAPASSAKAVAELQPPTQGEGSVLRTFGVGAQILKDLGVRRMRVLSAPKQMHGLSAFDLEVEAYVGEDS